jgi:hypothetical protein
MAGLIKTRTPGVYKAHRSGGTVYVARWREVDPTTGKARVRDKTFPTEVAARQYRASVEHAQTTGTYVPPNVGKVTVREVAERGKIACLTVLGITGPIAATHRSTSRLVTLSMRRAPNVGSTRRRRPRS